MSPAASSADTIHRTEGVAVRRLRVVWKLCALLVWTGTVVLLVGLTAAIGSLRPGVMGRSRARAVARRWLMRRWARGGLRLLGVRLQVQGDPPHPPFLLVSNHLSYIDIAVLASRAEGVFVAKQDVQDWPFWGPVSRSGGTLYIDRQSPRDALRILEGIERATARGDGVILFPEGTSTGGATVLPLKSPLLAGAARAGTPVHYATITYHTAEGEPPAKETVCWWGEMTFGAHFIQLLGLRRIEGHLRFGSTPLRGTDRKALARELHAAIVRDFQPVV